MKNISKISLLKRISPLTYFCHLSHEKFFIKYFSSFFFLHFIHACKMKFTRQIFPRKEKIFFSHFLFDIFHMWDHNIFIIMKPIIEYTFSHAYTAIITIFTAGLLLSFPLEIIYAIFMSLHDFIEDDTLNFKSITISSLLMLAYDNNNSFRASNDNRIYENVIWMNNLSSSFFFVPAKNSKKIFHKGNLKNFTLFFSSRRKWS